MNYAASDDGESPTSSVARSPAMTS
jgi:hypothetical protein